MNPRPDQAQMPLVSVVMPTFKRQAYFREALESAVRQSYANLEIIVGDNENSPETASLVEAVNDPRVTYLGRTENLGMVGNNLDLFRRAKGKYIVNLHDDDRLSERFVERTVAILEQDESVNIAFSDSFVIDAHGQIDFALTEKTAHDHRRDSLEPGKHQPALRAALLERAVPTTLCGLMRRACLDLEDFPLEVGGAYDLWLCYLALADGGAVYYLAERLAYRRVHPDADSAWSFVKLNLACTFCHRRFLQDERLRALWPEFRALIGVNLTRVGTMMLETGHTAQARAHLAEGWRFRPNVRAVIGLGLSYLPGSQTGRAVGRIQAALAFARRLRHADRPAQPVQHQLREH